MGKWLAGVAAAVLGSVIIWWLTHPGGPLNPPPPPPRKPDAVVKIIDFKISDAAVGQPATGTFTVYDESEIAADECQIWWYSGTKVGKELAEGKSGSESAVSERFGLRPKETRQITMRSLPYSEPGTFRSKLEIQLAKVG